MVRADSDGQEGANAQTDSKGAFRVEGLPAGPATVMVNENVQGGSRQQMRSFRVELVNNETTHLDADLDSGSRVTGKIAGAPQGWMTTVALVSGSVEIPEGANLRELYQTLGLIERTAGGAQAVDGAFEIEGAQPGDYTVLAITFDPQSGGQTFKHATVPVTVTDSGEVSVSITIP
jgi:hypothetical protein